MMYKIELYSKSTSDSTTKPLPPSEFLMAVRKGDISFIMESLLLENSFDSFCDEVDKDDTTALMHSIIYQQREAFDILLRFPKVDIHAKDIHGNNALIWAARFG